MSTAANPSSQLGIGQVFAIPSVRRLWIAQFVSILGDFLALFAILSVASFRLHATAPQVTLISVCYMAPTALIGPIAGVFVDRWDVKITMIASDLIRGVLALFLVFAPSLYAFYAILFALSLVSTFFAPAQSVTVRTIVPREGLLSANALLMQAFLITRILSPAIAGALVGLWGPASCFYIDVLSFFFSASMLAGIAIHRVAAPSTKGVRAVLADLGAGMSFLFHSAALAFVMVAMGAGFFVLSCFGPLIAIYVRDFLHAGPLAFGLISALIGIGMLVGTMLLRRFSSILANEKMVLAGLLFIGAGVLLMALVPLIALTAVSTFGIGFGIALIITPAQALMQGKTEASMVGRVSASFMSVIAVAQMLGLVLSGSVAGQIGIRNLFYACAVLLALITVAGYLRLPRQEA